MSTKRVIVPGERKGKKGSEDIRLLQYTRADTQENFDAFLTHHALVYILSGVKRINVAQSVYKIQPGELFLIPKGEYVMSEYIMGEEGFKSLMLFFDNKAAQDIIARLEKYIPLEEFVGNTEKKEAIRIIPQSPEVRRLFLAIVSYSEGNSPFLYELIRTKFIELIYLLLDSPYKKLILSFLKDAVCSEKPDIAAVVGKCVYSSATVDEMALLSGRSVSQFKREFNELYRLPPHQWITKKKLERAAFLLHTSDKSIEQVAEASGFVSQPHFARVFKKSYSVTPTEYRAKQNKG